MGRYAIQKVTSYSLLRRFTVGGTPLIAGTTGASSYTANNNLIGWWRFEEDVSSSGNTTDSSGKNHELVYTSATYRPSRSSVNIPGGLVEKYSYNFSPNKFATVAGSTTGDFTFGDGIKDESFSFAFWISPGAVGGVFGKGSGAGDMEYYFYVTTNYLLLVLGQSGGSLVWTRTGTTWNAAGGWKHIAITYDATPQRPEDRIKVYLDGSELVPTSYDQSGTYVAMSNSSEPLWIGKYYGSNFAGSLAGFSVFNSALTAQDAAALYAAATDPDLYLVTRNYAQRGSTATLSGTIDAYRQGVSVITNDQKYTGLSFKMTSDSPPRRLIDGRVIKDEEKFFDESIMPPITSRMFGTASNSVDPISAVRGRTSFVPNHELQFFEFGQAKEFKDDEPYEDMPGYDPVIYLRDPGGHMGLAMVYPYILFNVSMNDPDQYNGVLEPLTLRSRASRTSIDWPYEAHSVKGFWLEGAEDSRGRSCPILQQIETGNTSFEPFEDGGAEFFGQSTEGAVNVPGYLNNNPATINPWLDTTDTALFSDKLIKRGDQFNGGEDRGVFDALQVEGSMEEMTPRDSKSAHAGFIYLTTIDGTDSITFGGLTKGLKKA